jgi:hypothetical protein
LATIRDKQFNPSADEFKELAPELIKPAEAIERRRKDPRLVVLRSGYDFDEDAGKLTPRPSPPCPPVRLHQVARSGEDVVGFRCPCGGVRTMR